MAEIESLREAHAAQRNARQRERDLLRKDSLERALLLALGSSKPTLRVNSRSGVTVVAPPQHGEMNIEPGRALVFVTSEGAKAVAANAGIFVATAKISGKIEELKSFLDFYGIGIEVDLTIPVPFLSPERAGLDQALIADAHEASLWDLIVDQVPVRFRGKLRDIQ